MIGQALGLIVSNLPAIIEAGKAAAEFFKNDQSLDQAKEMEAALGSGAPEEDIALLKKIIDKLIVQGDQDKALLVKHNEAILGLSQMMEDANAQSAKDKALIKEHGEAIVDLNQMLTVAIENGNRMKRLAVVSICMASLSLAAACGLAYRFVG